MTQEQIEMRNLFSGYEEIIQFDESYINIFGKEDDLNKCVDRLPQFKIGMSRADFDEYMECAVKSINREIERI